MKFRSFYIIFFCRQLSVNLKNVAKSFSLISVCMVLLCQSANVQALVENIDQMETKVAQFLTDEYKASDAVKVEIKVNNLDQRLRLAKCDQEHSLILKDISKSGGNVNVEVSCKGTISWTILVPALARVYRPVAIASRNLERGNVITENDLTTEVKDISNFRMGFALIPEALIGKELKSAINKGETFRNSSLDSPLVIRRGDTVSMEATIGDISVRTNGTAVSDGRIGQQIKVKNLQSARVINARVVASGRVQSIL